MLRVITFNLNGIRSATRKGFFEWLYAQNADIVCLQELKAQEADMTAEMLAPAGYYGYFHYAEKKGYSGVAIYTKKKPDAVTTGLGWPEADTEGRYVEAHFGDLCVASLYLPSGTSGELRQNVKFDFLGRFAKYLAALPTSPKRYIVCGDWNIAHKEIDLKNWKSNQKTSGFLPEERAWLDTLFGKLGWCDAFRETNKESGQYTWWSNYANSWANNVGWRIDYHVVTPDLAETVQSASIFRDQKFSDHAPVTIDYNI